MLKPYMLYSRTAGHADVAMLAFAHTVREAKKIGWNTVGTELTDEFTDFTATLMRDSDYIMKAANQALLESDTPHVIDSPPSCYRCEMWGVGEIGEDGMCGDCRSDIES